MGISYPLRRGRLTGLITDVGTSAEFGEDAVKLDKNGMRSLFGKFKEYKENYEYVFGHQSEIAAMYYQNSRDQLLNNFKGTLKALRDAVAAFDSKLFDNKIAADAAADHGDSFREMHMIYSGVNVYFSDNELDRGLRHQ